MNWAKSVLPMFTGDSSEKLRITPDQVQIDTTHFRLQAPTKSALSRTGLAVNRTAVTWEYESIASPYGICNGYPGLLDRLATELRNAASLTIGRDVLITRLQRLLPSHDDCVLCRIRGETEQEAIAAVAQRIEENESIALNSPPATCLPHLAMLVAAVRAEGAVRGLIERQAVLLQRFAEDMRRYALKHDAARRYLESQEETTVAERGLLLVAGRRRVNFTPGRSGVPHLDRTLVKDAAVDER